MQQVTGESQAVKRYLSPTELAQSLGVSVPLVRLWRREGAPFVPCGRKPRYDLDEIVVWLKTRASGKK